MNKLKIEVEVRKLNYLRRRFMNPINEFYPLLNSTSKNVVITVHQKPDGDAMGSALGLCHFLKTLNHHPIVISPTNWADFFNWMPGIKDVLDFESQNAEAKQALEKADWLFCLDFNVLTRTKKMEGLLQEMKAVKILIDHHQQPDEQVFNFGISNTAKSSTCEMIYDFIANSDNSDKLNTEIATCLYTGIMTDTGSFRFPSTTPAVHRIVAHLMELGIHHTSIHENIYDNFLENRLRFVGNALLNRMEVLYEYNTALMSIPKGDIHKFDIKTGDTEGLVNYLHTIRGIKLAAIVIDREGERKWSFRSKGNFDVNTFARKHFNGGGHINAAGGTSKESLSVTVKNFYEIIKQYKDELQ